MGKINLPKSVAGGTWPVLVFAAVVFVVGIWVMKSTGNLGAADVTALVAAVLGVVGTHVGHVAGHELEVKNRTAERLVDGIALLAESHKSGNMTDQEFTTAKAKLLGE